MKRKLYPIVLAVLFFVVSSETFSAAPAKTDLLKAVKRATEFMMDTVSNQGGFLWKYSNDFSEQWGEIPARKSMVWVQKPGGTVGVGDILLEAYRVTGDPAYLTDAERAADVLILGQHPSGGWDYFIDINPIGLQAWYDKIPTECWGWEEFYHNFGNCTFDDFVTTDVTRFLLNLYMTTLDPKYRAPLFKALGFILDAQYPTGGWPQRYPLPGPLSHDKDAGYTADYTFNDDVIGANIRMLLEAYEKLGNEKYKKAAYRGMDFVMISQMPPPQAGWAQQYDMNLHPAPARSCEPGGLLPIVTVSNIHYLEKYYKITGDKRYLRGIPDAIQWLEDSILPPEKRMDGHTHAMFYEVGSNRPLFVHREGNTFQEGRYWIDYKPVNLIKGYGTHVTINVEQLQREYERVNTLTPKEAMTEYQKERSRSKPIPSPSPREVKHLIDSLDPRGAWVEDFLLVDFSNYMNGSKRTVHGIVTATYIRNMKTLLNYLEKSNK